MEENLNSAFIYNKSSAAFMAAMERTAGSNIALPFSLAFGKTLNAVIKQLLMHI